MPLAQGSVGRALLLLQDPQFAERHDRAVASFVKVMDSGASEIFEVIDIFKKDRESAKETLGIWLTLLRDMLALQCGHNDFMNENAKDTLRRYASAYSGKALAAFSESLAKGIRALDGNGNVQMVCEGILLKWMEDKIFDNGHRRTV
jgi:hypothetical protein